jgi:hypothetical protein
MTGIARNIELYQLAYRLAWKSADPNIGLRLHHSIRAK